MLFNESIRSTRDSPCGMRDSPCGMRDSPCGMMSGRVYYDKLEKNDLAKARKSAVHRKVEIAERNAVESYVRTFFGFQIGEVLSDRRNVSKKSDGRWAKSYRRKLKPPFAACSILTARYTQNDWLLYRIDVYSEYYKRPSIEKMRVRLDEMATAIQSKYKGKIELEKKGLSYVARFKYVQIQELSLGIDVDDAKNARFKIHFENTDIREHESGAKSLGAILPSNQIE